MKKNNKKSFKEVQTVFSKFAPNNRPKTFRFGGIIEIDGKDKLVVDSFEYRGQAERYFKAYAKKNHGTYKSTQSIG